MADCVCEQVTMVIWGFIEADAPGKTADHCLGTGRAQDEPTRNGVYTKTRTLPDILADHFTPKQRGTAARHASCSRCDCLAALLRWPIFGDYSCRLTSYA